MSGENLVTIVKNNLAFNELMEEVDGELCKTSEEWLEENKQNLANKADGYKYAMDMLEDAEEILKKKAQPFLDAAKACKNRREGLKDRLKWAMQTLDLQTIEGPDYTFTLSTQGNKLVIDNEEAIPASFFQEVVELVLDSDLLKKNLEGGEKVDGAHLESVQALRTKITSIKLPNKKKGKKDDGK